MKPKLKITIKTKTSFCNVELPPEPNTETAQKCGEVVP